MKRVDDNQKEIVKGLRAVGAHVQSLSDVGDGCPDLLIAFRGIWYICELKDGAKHASRRRLTPKELAWHKKFNTQAPVFIFTNLDEALKTIGAISPNN